MKVGAEPKKVGAFVVLVVIAGIVYWMNSASDAPAPAVARPAADAAVSAPAADGNTKAAPRRQASTRAPIVEWLPKPPASVDPSKVDPTLRLDLLAKVQSVDLEGGKRNVFQFCQDCPTPEQIAKAAAAAAAPIPKVDPLHPNGPQPTPPSADPPKPPPPPPPVVAQIPPINLKYYGYSNKRLDGEKKAFFLDGEEIIVAAEGEIIKKQYKVVRISTTSVQMEDTASKSTQTIPIQQDAPV